jgi:hypothetical protein
MRALDASLTAFEKEAKLAQKATNITDKYKSKTEKLTDKKNELNNMFELNLISASTFNKAMQDTEKQLKKDYTATMSVQGLEAVESGTAGAVARLAEYAALRPVVPVAGAANAAKVTTVKPGGTGGVTAKQSNVSVAQGGSGGKGQTSHESVVEGLLDRIAIGVETDAAVRLQVMEV